MQLGNAQYSSTVGFQLNHVEVWDEVTFHRAQNYLYIVEGVI